MRGWDVGDLLHRRGGILSREKTMKTSTSTILSANWNVNGLLDRLPDDLNKRHGRTRFHFHQLFHCLRRTKDCANSAGRTHKLGHFDNLLGNREVERCRLSSSHSTICGTNAWSIGTSGTRSTSCSTVRRCNCSCGSTSSNGAGGPAAGASPTSSPGVHRKVPGTSRLGEGWGGVGERRHLPERARVVHLAPSPPRPCRRLSPWS